MTTQAIQTRSLAVRIAPMAVFLLGFATMTVAGHVQASTLHDAAHDTRHATGFPCH